MEQPFTITNQDLEEVKTYTTTFTLGGETFDYIYTVADYHSGEGRYINQIGHEVDPFGDDDDAREAFEEIAESNTF